MTARKTPKPLQSIAEALAAAALQDGPLPEPATAASASNEASGDPRGDLRGDAEGFDPYGRPLWKTREFIEVPGDLPVQPLGTNNGGYYYLDGLKQLRMLLAKDHSLNNLKSLFAGHVDYLLAEWGRTTGGKDPKFTGGLHSDLVGTVLMEACAREGVINPARQVRGVGTWADAKGALVMHLGDQVFTAGEYRPPARYGEHIYPAMPAMMRPSRDLQNADAGVELLTMLESWHWRHPLQAQLVLGWIAQGFVAGALRWRTHMIGDGEAGSGKSSLKELMQGLYGEWMLGSSNLTEAGLRQTMQGRAQPVFLDEFEAGDNPLQKAKVVALLRQASSGGIVQRGGDDHKATEFSVQFPAFLTSIVSVSLQAQDESRMVRVALLPIRPGSVLPDLTPARLAKLGQRIMRRMLDQWQRFPHTLAIYRDELRASAGFNDRAQDTFGTLLACADLLLYEHAPEGDELGSVIDRLAAMVAPARAEAIDDQVRCLGHLLQSVVDRGGGVKRSVASWIRDKRARGMDALPDMLRVREAERALGLLGLRVFDTTDAKLPPGVSQLTGPMIFVSNTHEGLRRLYQDTPWPGSAGAIGGWTNVLRRLDGARVPIQSIKVGGSTQRGTMVPLYTLARDGSVDDMIDWGDGE